MSPLEDVEVVMLRRFEAAVRAGDDTEVARLHSALDVFREAVEKVLEWSNLTGGSFAHD